MSVDGDCEPQEVEERARCCALILEGRSSDNIVAIQAAILARQDRMSKHIQSCGYSHLVL